jgi:DNA-directed RNA polymerase beta subunit/DNA-directed RNA polymerase beta' subunit
MLQPSLPEAAAMSPSTPTKLNNPNSRDPYDVPEGVTVRGVGDVAAMRTQIYDSVLNAAATMPEVVGNQYTLRLADVHYAEDDPDFDATAEKQAILAGSSLGRRLRGTWQLSDNATGQLVSERKATVASVPAILRDGSFLRNGTRYVMGYQQRLKPGAYARYKKSGEPELHINAMPGTGRSHRYVLEPETGVFHVQVEHAKIPLVPLLQSLGVTREQMEEAWGKELTDKNFAKKDPKAVGKLYDRFVPKFEQTAEDRNVPERAAAKIQEAIAAVKLDPEVTENTLGRAADSLDADLILRGTAKSLRMLRGQEDADDRDNLAFASYHSAADIFAERFVKDYGKFRRELLYKASRKGDLASIPSGALDRYVNAAIFRSGLAQTVEDVNPVEIAATLTKITRFGEGGLPDTTSAPDESRNVHPSQFGYIDGVLTPESLKIGIDGYLASNAMIGSDNKLYTKMRDNKTGKEVLRSPDKLLRSTVSVGAAPMEGYELAIAGGRLRMLPAGTAEYSLPNFENSFSVMGNLVPLKGNMFGQRASMAGRMASQAMAVDNAEAPLVQTGVPEDDVDESYEDRLGARLGAIRAEERGRVVEVSPTHVTVKYAGGREQKHVLDNNRPGARKTIYHQTPVVELGQEVEPNQLLVRSNYVDSNGTAALGVNARTALMAWPDAWEDGIVVSQSFADRMRVQQAYKYKIEPGEGETVDKRGYLQLFGNRYKSEQLKNIDERGVIKPGTIVNEGDPLILGVRKRDGAKTRVHKQSKMDWGDSSLRWDHAHEGVVTDVFHTDKGSQVVVKTSKPLEDADKLSGRAGNKGVVTIKPDNEMPHDAEGNPIEVIVSPLAVPSRGNSSFPLEMLLGKIAAKRGKPFKIKDFRGEDIQRMAMQEAEAHGVSDTETLTDPKTGRQIPGVLTGPVFMMALHHMASSKASSRGLGTYSSDDTPARGGEEGAQAKRYSGQMAWAGMSHGAYAVSREAATLRGTRNDDYWNAFMSGEQIAAPSVAPQYEAFVNKLRAAGINPVRQGNKTQLMAMIDADVDDLAGDRYVSIPETVDIHKDLKPIPGGLFDPRLFGDGTRWAAIKLPEAMPNPVFEEPIRRMLGLTEKDFREVLGGKKELDGYGSGPAGLKKRLESMDLDQEITKAREAIAGTRKVARDDAVKRLKYLKSLKDTDTLPADLMITKVPVLPPRLRPIAKLGGKGGVVVSDPNFLYRELMFANEVVSDLKDSVDDLSSERLAVYDAHKALVGLTDPASRELRQRKVKGLIKQVVGDNPKASFVQRKLISGNVDTVGRGVIAPDTSLDMDSFGLPENIAFDMFTPYVVRNMVLKGIPRVAALEHLKQRDDVARRSLLEEVDKRPVMLSRAPILHKYGDIALQAKLIKGDAIRLNPLVYTPLGGDNDGNCVDYDEVLTLALSLSSLYVAGDEFVSQLLEAAGVRLTADEIISIRSGEDRHEVIQVRIGEMPRVGEPTWPQPGQMLYNVPEGVYVLSYDHASGQPVWAAVDSFTVDLKHDVVAVKTARKREIIVSDNESLAVLCDDTCEIKRISPAKAIGKFSPSIRRSGVSGDQGTFDEGWLYAAAVANGWRTNKLFGYSHNSSEARAKVLELAKQQWDDNFIWKEYFDDGKSANKFSNSAKLHLSGPAIATLDLDFVHPDITKYGTDERQWVEPRVGDKPWAKFARPALYKRISPSKFGQWSEQAWLGFLCGYLENGGTLVRAKKSKGGEQARVAINTSSPYLYEGMQHVLRMLGIRYSSNIKQPTEQSHKGFSLCLSNTDIDRLIREGKLRFYTPDANTWLQWRTPIAVADNGNDTIDCVPLPDTLRLEMLRLVGSDKSLRAVISDAQRLGSLGRSRALRVAQWLKTVKASPQAEAWVRIAESHDVHWDRVVSVEDRGVREVYDIGVPSTKVFAVNSGLVVWDTVNLNIPHSREAVAEARERMMPSKMLIATNDFKSPVFTPTQDLLLGLHIASRAPRKGVKTRYFATMQDAKAALRRGEIDVDTPVKIGNRKT